jgi:hypothetical protein
VTLHHALIHHALIHHALIHHALGVPANPNETHDSPDGGDGVEGEQVVRSRVREESADEYGDGNRHSDTDVFKGLIRRQHLTTILKYRDLCR